MAAIFHEEDSTLEPIAGLAIAIVGYGNQGRSQALNLRDSGMRVLVGNIDDDYRKTAIADGFSPLPIRQAAAQADVIFMLVPDEVMPEVYRDEVEPGLAPGKMLVFAHGYNVAFGLITPPPGVDVVMVAPRMIGAGVRDTYVSGAGFPSFVGVHQDASGRAQSRMLALAKALGSLRAGCIEMSFNDEATLDLFTEQAFGPAFGAVMGSAVNALVDAGYPPEAVLLELYLSGEFAYSLEKGREMGMRAQHRLHSHTSQYGTITRAPRFFDLVGPMREKMSAILGEIRSGAFAKEWSSERDAKLALLEKAHRAADGTPMARWEDATRAAFRIGDAAPKRTTPR
jgi:ketol-acid reductoisomerase